MAVRWSRRAPGRGRVLAALVAAVLALTSCAGGLSMDSPVQPGLEVGANPADPVRVLPAGPADGAAPQQIVRDFLRAGAVSDGDYEVARSFMAAGATTPWRPDSSIVVFTDESALTSTPVDETTVRMRVRATATIDAAGRYRDLPGATVVEAAFGLTRVSGEWRVDRLPPGFGLWLSSSDVERLYRPFRIHYLSTAERRLVPDVRWFWLGKGLLTRLARAQLAPVPDHLAGAARTEVPPGTRLTVDAVPIDGGIATVDLDLPPARAGGDPVQRQNLWAQFVATLTQVSEVQQVALKVRGSDLELPDLEAPPGSLAELDFPRVSSPAAVTPVLRTGSRLVRVDPQRAGDRLPREVTPVQDLPEVPQGWVWLAMSATGEEFAAVGGDRAQLARWRRGRRVEVPALGTRLSRPAYDRHGMLWVAGVSTGTRVWVIDTAADARDAAASQPRELRADWLAGRLVRSLRVSPDGQRVAVVSTDATGRSPRVEVAGVVRSPNGTPVSLAGVSLPVAATLTLALDVVWLEETSVAVLGRISPTDVVRPWVALVGGRVSALSEVSGAVSVTTTGGARALVVTTDRGQVLARAGSSWLPVGRGTDFAVAGV